MTAFDLFTIGHSNISAERFIALLRGTGIDAIADVRSIPPYRDFARGSGRRTSRRSWAKQISIVCPSAISSAAGHAIRHSIAMASSITRPWRNGRASRPVSITCLQTPDGGDCA